MVAIQDLLDGERLHLAGLEEDVTLDGIDGGVGPRCGASGEVVADLGDSAVLQPVDVLWNVLGVEAGVVMLHVMMVRQLAGKSTAQELRSFLISPVGVSIVPKEVGVHLGVMFDNELLRLSELMHPLVVLVQSVGVLVEERSILHVLVIEDRGVLKVGSKSASGRNSDSNGKLHF